MQLPKLDVVGSVPTTRSSSKWLIQQLISSQLFEHLAEIAAQSRHRVATVE
jgi:hypothetical protein